jgi:eukaryotic-like serine/threonine-protein kinase
VDSTQSSLGREAMSPPPLPTPGSAVGPGEFGGEFPPNPPRDSPATRVVPQFRFVPKPIAFPSEPGLPSVQGYEILSIIGSGGMGIVYKARHRVLQRTVALKTLQGAALADPEFRQRLHAEAEAVARLQHPNIIQVFEIGAVDAQAGELHPSPFIALEFVDGGSLAARTYTPQSPRYAARMVENLARAVHAAHQVGVVHRDLKPANVLLTSEGEPKVADFGVAKQLGGERDARGRFVTRAGTVIGTPEYMAPEQVAGEAPGPAIDIHALGVILYELLTGRVPFQAATAEQTMYLVLTQEPVSPRQLQPTLPRDLDTICLKCLEKAPGQRYESAEALADDLACWTKGLPIRARPIGAVEGTARWARRNPAVAALSAAVVLVALAGLTGIVWKWREAQAHAEAADTAAAEARDNARAERWQRYRTNIVAASIALQSNKVGTARHALENAPEEHRNWEWRHFQHQVDTAKYVLRWPDAVVTKVVITPGGAFVALRDVDNSARVWDVLGRKVVRTFPSARGLANMEFSPDGKTLAFPAPDDSCILQDVATDRMGVLRGHEKRAFTFRFSLDATRLATLSYDGTCRAWDAVTGKQLLVVGGNEPNITHLDLSADGRRLAEGSNGEVRVWDVATGRQTALLRGHEHGVSGTVFNRQADRLLTAEGYPGNTVRLWDVATGQQLAVMRGHGNQLKSMAFSPDNTRIATSALDGTARLWDAAGGNPQATLQGHKGWVYRVAFSPDGKRLLTASQDHTVRIWDGFTGEPLAVLRGHAGEVYDAAYTADGAFIVSASRDGTVRVWDAQAEERNGVLRGHTNFVYGVAFHPDGERAASAGWDGTIRIWDATTGMQKALLNQGEKTIVTSVAFHPAGRLLASIGRDSALRLWDVAAGEEVQRWNVATDGWRDTRLAFSRQGDLLAAGSRDGVVHLWDVNRRVEVAALRGHRDVIRDVAFSPDGRWLASAGDGEERIIRIWDVARQAQVQVLEGHTSGVYALAFDDEGRLLASGSTDGTVRLWDAATWREVAVLKHGANVYGVAFTPDGTRLASACADNTIRFWDVGSHEEVAELTGHEAYVHAIAFSRDGARLISGSGDFTVRIWDSVPPLDRARPGK